MNSASSPAGILLERARGLGDDHGVRSRARAVLAAACSIHFVHDGFSDILYVLLPLWASEFGLSFAQVGAIRTAYSGGMSAFQIPAGLLAERFGERWLLALGTAVTACGFIVAGLTGGFLSLLAVLLVAGLGSGVQHPLSSSIVAKAYETGPRRAALGTYNFSGDLGKVAVPFAVALGAAAVGWRWAGAAYGVLGIVAAIAILPVLARLGAGTPDVDDGSAAPTAASSGWGIRDVRGFQALTAIGMIDNATRTGFLTFLPFALIAKGSSVAGIGTAMALLFAGGAAGKFACGLVAERFGVIRTVVLTEGATALGILAIIAAPLPVALAILPLIGVALNGTSSVLYGTVADLVNADRRSRAYGLYYTTTIASSALAPSLYGMLGDAVGVSITLAIVAAIVLVTIPLCLALRDSVAEPAQI
jgi:MFS transporter, FSR family, fosmidomycin resistance protein